MRSARRFAYRAVVPIAVALLLAAAAGCQTTQEKATLKQAESKRILEQREQKRRAKSHRKEGEKR